MNSFGGAGMSLCWFCHWGWPEPIANIYLKAVRDLGGHNLSPLHFGPAHSVWEDENFDNAQWCLDNFSKYCRDYQDWELAIVRRSLQELLEVPDELKEWPKDYDGNHPELFPPPAGVKMVKVR